VGQQWDSNQAALTVESSPGRAEMHAEDSSRPKDSSAWSGVDSSDSSDSRQAGRQAGRWVSGKWAQHQQEQLLLSNVDGLL